MLSIIKYFLYRNKYPKPEIGKWLDWYAFFRVETIEGHIVHNRRIERWYTGNEFVYRLTFDDFNEYLKNAYKISAVFNVQYYKCAITDWDFNRSIIGFEEDIDRDELRGLLVKCVREQRPNSWRI